MHTHKPFSAANAFWAYVALAIGVPIGIMLIGAATAAIIHEAVEETANQRLSAIVTASLFALGAALWSAIYQIWYWVTRIGEVLHHTRNLAAINNNERPADETAGTGVESHWRYR